MVSLEGVAAQSEHSRSIRNIPCHRVVHETRSLVDRLPGILLPPTYWCIIQQGISQQVYGPGKVNESFAFGYSRPEGCSPSSRQHLSLRQC